MMTITHNLWHTGAHKNDWARQRVHAEYPRFARKSWIPFLTGLETTGGVIHPEGVTYLMRQDVGGYFGMMSSDRRGATRRSLAAQAVNFVLADALRREKGG